MHHPSAASSLNFEGHSLFREHLICSLLSRRPIHLTLQNEDNEDSASGTNGMRPFEANFLKFIMRITAGSSVSLTRTNNPNTNGEGVLHFTPGVILGGVFTHTGPSNHRSVSYLAEAALLLLPFAKHDSCVTFTGATQSELDLAVDTIRTVTVQWLRRFGVTCSVRVVRRGGNYSREKAANATGVEGEAGGIMVVEVKAVRRLTNLMAIERGRVRRVRGIAFACRTSHDLPQRAATAAKGVLLNVLPDVYVVTDMDQGKGRSQGGSSGYGVMLVAETTSKDCIISQETTALPQESPEQVGERAARLLLDQILQGGCVDAHHQLFVLLLMAVSPDQVSTVRFGQLTKSAVSAMMLMESYFGVSCALKEESSFAGDELPRSTLITCLGSGLINVWKTSS